MPSRTTHSCGILVCCMWGTWQCVVTSQYHFRQHQQLKKHIWKPRTCPSEPHSPLDFSRGNCAYHTSVLLSVPFSVTHCTADRYLAIRSHFPVPGSTASAPQGGASGSSLERSPLEKNPVQPSSLRRHHLYATPVSRRSLMLAGRGKQALQEGQAWQSKVNIGNDNNNTQYVCQR